MDLLQLKFFKTGSSNFLIVTKFNFYSTPNELIEFWITKYN